MSAEDVWCTVITARASPSWRLGPERVPSTQFPELRPPHFPGGSDGKESSCNAGDPGSIPGSGRSPGEENGNPLQNSCLGNPLDRGAWRATVHGVAELDMAE